eukprot:scaffold5223_cov104-Isochrysis_galbana.AAC.6
MSSLARSSRHSVSSGGSITHAAVAAATAASSRVHASSSKPTAARHRPAPSSAVAKAVPAARSALRPRGWPAGLERARMARVTEAGGRGRKDARGRHAGCWGGRLGWGSCPRGRPARERAPTARPPRAAARLSAAASGAPAIGAVCPARPSRSRVRVRQPRPPLPARRGTGAAPARMRRVSHHWPGRNRARPAVAHPFEAGSCPGRRRPGRAEGMRRLPPHRPRPTWARAGRPLRCCERWRPPRGGPPQQPTAGGHRSPGP